MNKKLFSWKALAGLALLVAMGMTSCKNTTEVDPNDPYNTKTPTTPSATSKGSANVTITVVASTDLETQYDKWAASLNADQKKAIADAKEFTIAINAKGYKLDGGVLTLPKVWSPANDKTLNVVFTSGFAEAKNALVIDADANNSGANVNVTLPAGEYDLTLTAANVRPVLNSEAGATVKTLNATISSVAKNNLTIGDGVKVNILAADNDVKKAGTGDIVAVKLVAADSPKQGEKDGTIKKNGLNFKNLEIAGKVEVKGFDGDNKLNLENVHIAGANELTIGADVASIASISGDLDSNKKLQANVVSDAIVGKLSKVILAAATTGGTIEIKDGSALDNVQIKDLVKASANIGSISGVTFDKDVTINFDKSNVNLALNSVKIGSTIKVEGKEETEEVITYAVAKYSVATGKWTEAADDASVALNDKVTSVGADGKLYDKDNNEVIPTEDIIRFVKNTVKKTAVPENTSITLDKATMDASGINGDTVTKFFGGAQSLDPGYAVILNDTKYTWKKTSDSTPVKYELRK